MAEHRQHAWVKHTVVPVSVISDPDSVDGFIALDMPDYTGGPWEVFGCNVCSVPLNHDTVDTSCAAAIEHGGNESNG
jgi:hypothetical protein